MLGYNKPFPLGFCLFAFILFLLPSQIVAPVKLLILLPLTPFTNLFTSRSDSPLIGAINTSETNVPDDEIPSARIARLEKEIEAIKADYIILTNENRELKQKLKSIADFIGTQPSARKVQYLYKIIVADVIIPTDSTNWRRSITINQGSSSGITTGLPVIYGKYLVGKIVECGLFNSRVQLLTDPLFRIRAFVISPQLQPGRKTNKESSRILPTESPSKNKPEHPRRTEFPDVTSGDGGQVLASGSGVLEGRSTGYCVLKWVSRSIPVKPDWLVLSASDIAGIYPRGLIIGKVTSVEQESYFSLLKVTPLLDFNSLESVLIIEKKE